MYFFYFIEKKNLVVFFFGWGEANELKLKANKLRRLCVRNILLIRHERDNTSFK